MDPGQLEHLFDQFGKVIGGLDRHTSPTFFTDLLGPEEKIMIAKRLAAIAMFNEGNSSYRVWQLLKISPSTAERIRLNYEVGRYKNITLALTANRRNYEEFWEALEVILSAGLPPRGRGRWKGVLGRLSE